MRDVDRLGRLVVPIEIRKQLGIVAGDELEYYVDGGTLALTVKEPVNERFVRRLARNIGGLYPAKLLVCNTKRVLTVLGLPDREYVGRAITWAFRRAMEAGRDTKGIAPVEVLDDRVAFCCPFWKGVQLARAVFQVEPPRHDGQGQDDRGNEQ